jgi:hypothetical protein
VHTKRLVSALDFDNRRQSFQAIHSDTPSRCLHLGRILRTPGFSVLLDRAGRLWRNERRFTSHVAEDIARINPNTKTAPIFRSKADAELTKKIHARVPVLIDEGKGEAGNPWGVSFLAMFHMSNDSHLFRTAAQLRGEGFEREGSLWQKGEECYVPLYEAKMIHQFDHRWADYDEAGRTTRDVTVAEKADPAFEPTPRYWVPESEVEARLAAKGWTRGWLLGWRDITNATNERTVIASVFPRVGVNHKLPLLFTIRQPHRAAALLAT